MQISEDLRKYAIEKKIAEEGGRKGVLRVHQHQEGL
jgi:hypothetical protein